MCGLAVQWRWKGRVHSVHHLPAPHVCCVHACLCVSHLTCRQVQDEFAAASHRKAAAAQAAGKFNAEIVPVRTKVKDPKSGSEQQVRGCGVFKFCCIKQRCKQFARQAGMCVRAQTSSCCCVVVMP